MKFPRMKDMARSQEAEMSMGLPFALGEMVSKYPCGLQITLCDPELEKLGLDEEFEVGDLIHLFSMAEVTGISKNDDGSGEKCRITLQLKFMAAENEELENEEEGEPEVEEHSRKAKKPHLYKK